jgi:hypothetical protein
MKKLHIQVSSVREYFALPNKKREFCGLYKVPSSLNWTMYDDEEGWDAFFKKIAKEYPIQYFFRVWLFGYSNSFYMSIKYNVFWPLGNLFKCNVWK